MKAKKEEQARLKAEEGTRFSEELRLKAGDGGLCGGCWLPLDIVTLVLSAFGSGELLDIDITKSVPLVFILSLAFPCLCNDDIKSEHSHNRHTGGVGRDSM